MTFHVSLVGRANLRAEIYRQLRQAILDGHLRPGAAVPPTRELARSLKVSRNTVEVAYERLQGEGFLTSRVGSGTHVSTDILAAPEPRRPPRPVTVLRARPRWEGIAPSDAFARPAEFDFRTGQPDLSLFPYKTWRRFVVRELRSAPFASGGYQAPAGHPDLREAIVRHVALSRGTRFSPEQVVITNGTQQALDLIARVLVDPGETVAMEDPGYQPPRRLFTSLGLRVVGVPVDREGLVVDALPRRARLVYVTPSHQYPLGVSMSVPRRIALLDWAERNDAAIVEDDYDSEFRFGGRPVEPLHTLDAAGRVIYVGSFSKTLLPSLRLGFLAAPPSLLSAVHAAKFVSDWHTPLAMQGALARFIDEGAYARHLRRMGNIYRARHALVTEILARDFASDFILVPSDNGLHVAIRARRSMATRTDRLVARAAEAGVAVQPLSRFAVGARPMAGFAIGYGAVPIGEIPKGLGRLREVL